MLENWLDRIRHKPYSGVVRIVVAVIFTYLAFSEAVRWFGDLGFSDEVKRLRLLLLIVLLVISIVSVFLCEFIRAKRQVAGLTKQLASADDQINESRARVESVLRLMEKYKRAAYADVLQNLNRLLILVEKREDWQANQARVTKVRVKPYSGAETIDPEFARRERIEAIINIGRQAGVREGMEFLVRDIDVQDGYGLIAVTRVDTDGAICALVDDTDSGFWRPILESSKQGASVVMEAPNNRIVPNVPDALGSITPEAARDLRSMISKITSQSAISEGEPL